MPELMAAMSPTWPQAPAWNVKSVGMFMIPELGDEVWQIPAGTAFAGLPAHWSCPECGGKKQDFLLLDD